ncbi:MAG: serine hydrolase domain-containing protein, partial [Terriglobales bacterium]
MRLLRQVTLFISILVLALTSVASAAPAAGRKKPKSKSKPKPLVLKEMGNFTAVDALVQEQVNNEAITGAVLVVGHDGNIVHQKAFGRRAVSPKREPMTLDTVFDLASLTKVVATTPCVMRLLQYGQIRLEEPFARHISEFGANGKENVTIRQMLTHYSGLRPDLDLNPPWEGQETAFRLAHEEKLQAPPGAQFVYSDINFLELGELVQQASGLSLDKYAEVHIFQPMGMTHTMFRPPASIKSKIAETLSVDNKRILRGLV